MNSDSVGDTARIILPGDRDFNEFWFRVCPRKSVASSRWPALDGVRERKRFKESFSLNVGCGEGEMAKDVDDMEACASALRDHGCQ